jgi:hypothetical protein
MNPLMNLVITPLKKITALLLSVSLFALTLFLFSPATIYLGNFMEFSSLFPESLLFFLIVSLALILILSAILLSFWKHERGLRIAVSLLVTFSILLWLQGNIIRWQYGVLNGRDIPWDDLLRYGIIDSAIWILLLSFSVIKADLVFRIARLLSGALIAVQILTVALAWFQMPKDQAFKQQDKPADTLFLFSQHTNVIIIVLDTFQSDIFQDIVKSDADLRSSFDGFTYFRNSLAGSDATSVSLPNMLTATSYDNSMPYLEYVKKAYLENSLPKTLTDYGFSIDVYPIYDYMIYKDYSGVASSGKRLRDWEAFFKEQASIADLALFRDLPHFVKRLVYNNQKWFASALLERYLDARAGAAAKGQGQPESAEISAMKYYAEYVNSKKSIRKNWDATFINRMIPASGTMKGVDAFKFYHLNGVHLQLVLNEALEYGFMEPSREGIQRQGTGILKIASMMLDRLKQLKVYDNSLIFIVGDHGSGLSVASINPTPEGETLNARGVYKGFFENFKSAAIPLILVKKVNSRGALKTSDAPVSLSDIPETVAGELGLDTHFPGESMFSVQENQSRQRIYRAFYGPQEDVQYFAPLWEYAVNGFSWDDTSWRETGNVWYPKGN